MPISAKTENSLPILMPSRAKWAPKIFLEELRLYPLECLDLRGMQGKTLVLNCLGGKRSAMALDKCGIAQAAVDTHLAGGFGAWQSAGLPIER